MENVSKKFKQSFCMQIVRAEHDSTDPVLKVEDSFSGIKVKNLTQALRYL
jgi:hypothetical protein